MAIFDVPQRFSQKWVHDKVPTMDSTEFHAMFHEAATRGWDEDELHQLARMWAEESGKGDAQLADGAHPRGFRCDGGERLVEEQVPQKRRRSAGRSIWSTRGQLTKETGAPAPKGRSDDDSHTFRRASVLRTPAAQSWPRRGGYW